MELYGHVPVLGKLYYRKSTSRENFSEAQIGAWRRPGVFKVRG